LIFLKKEQYLQLESIILQFRKANAGLLDLSKEEVVEMRRQIQTPCTNLNCWFDSWEIIMVHYGFGADMMSKSGTKILSSLMIKNATLLS
jgi:hypothetical protein